MTTQERLQELEMELAYKDYALVEWQAVADKHNCSTPKELDSYIESLIFFAQ